jgi:small subunit ribosomal protein S9
MADDETTRDETTEGPAAESTGPVAGSDDSSSQAAGESPDPTPPVEDPSEGPSVEAPEEPEASADGSAGEAEEPSEEGGDEAEEGGEEAEEGGDEVEEPSEEAEADEVVVEVEVEEEAEESEVEAPAAAEKKKDVIPGADLEPIAVEPDAPELSAEERARLEAEEEERASREAALADAEDAEAATRAPAKMESGSRFLATGKRKRSIARVTLVPGDGKFEVNKRSLEEFFPRPLHQTMARQPLAVSGYEGNVDVRVRVHGGGISGQAGAVRHGVARALTEIDAELRGDLKRRGFLTRDARVKERRKAGFKKARKKPQFSKR